METLKRICPQCGKELQYTNINNLKAAERIHSKCKECGLKNRRSYKGKDNPFFGKNHSNEIKELISKFNSEERILSDDFLQKARENLSKVTNSRPLYDIWLEKYGKEIADEKLESFRLKQSVNNTGEKNKMFGKPSPQGSGNGWSGWYKDWYFRSLRELSYMINVIEAEGLSWKTPDKNFKIPYMDYEGQLRTYFPDFIINECRLVEIKPVKLHGTPKVLAKRAAAEKFCQNHNMIYEIIDPIILTNDQIKSLYLDGKIKFLSKYEEKFKEKYLQ